MTEHPDISFESARTATSAIELTVECQNDFLVSSPFSVPRLVEHFVTLGYYGGLAGGTHSPDTASARVQSMRVVDKLASWVIAMPGADPGAAAVLYNLVVFSHLHVAPLRRAVVRSGLAQSKGVPELPLETTQALKCAVRTALDSDEGSVCIRFASLPTSGDAQQIDSLLMAWVYVIAAGGMSDDIWNTTRPLLVAEEDPEWVGDEVWLRLSDIDAGEIAFAPLLNALHSVEGRIAPIVTVEIE